MASTSNRTEPAIFQPRIGFDPANGRVGQTHSDLAAELLTALLQCQEYLRYSFGSGSDINPYPAMDAAIERAQKELGNV
ncbi:hypothetical protein [Allorhizobium ampelinum]|uniref:hypothetical protein n=1 Tax=Allorhizobium ampelinum TaxID=3025782 RepID=UPI000B406CC3|nr:hypothetical protein [Allorhizobium ampelinum]NTA27445.1 hypothetical protein [Allorhizobium ampelinum]OVE94502.1 hypothetical protein B7W85_13195 [Allorhizobium ampelinum]